MAYFDQQENDNTDAGIFFEYLETQDGPLPTSVEGLILQYSCYHAGITPSTVPCTSNALLHALRRLGFVRSWRDQDITWSRSSLENMKERQDQREDATGFQDTQQRGRERRRQNRRKNQWRPIAGGLDEIEHQATGEKDEGLWKPGGSDGEEEIVWSGREKLSESVQSLGMENLSLHENQRGKNAKNISPKENARRALASTAAAYKVPLCGPPFVVPISASSYVVPSDAPDYKDRIDCLSHGAEYASFDKGRFKPNTVGPDVHQHRPPHEYRGARAENKGIIANPGGWHAPPHLPQFASSSDFLQNPIGLPSVPYYAGQDIAPEILDPFYVGPPCYRGQFPSCDLLGVHTAAPDSNWRSLNYGYPVASSNFSYDGQGGKQAQSDGNYNVGRRGGGSYRSGRGRKSSANRSSRSGRGGSGVKSASNRETREEASSSTDVGENSKRGIGAESEISLLDPVPGARRDRLWKASREVGGDVFVSQPFSPNHDRPQTISVGATEGASISVVNNGTERVKLLAVKMLYSSPKGSFSLSLAPPSRATSSTERNAPVIDTSKSVLKSQNGVLPGGPWVIGPGLHLTFKLGCTASAMGLHKAVLLFDFGTQKIVRYISLICEDEIAKAMAPSEPYARLPRPRIRSFYKFVPGVPPPLPVFKKRLDFYPIPPHVKEAILKKEKLPVFSEGLRKENYCDYFSALEFAEELQMEVSGTYCGSISCENVFLTKMGELI